MDYLNPWEFYLVAIVAWLAATADAFIGPFSEGEPSWLE